VLGHGFVELHERAARRAGKPRWADKVPENVLHRAAWERLLGDRWLFVHVVRGPLDTVASMQGRFALALPQDVAGQAEVYRTYVEAGLAVERALPDRSVRVVYEELCADPARVVERLMNRLGEEFEPIQLAFNSVPHDEGLEDPEVARTDAVHRDGVGRWRSVLDENDAGLVWSRTHDLWETIDSEGRHPEAILVG
jgi:Sulfotransferase family